MATLTVYANVNDGYISSSSSTYAAARSGGTKTAYDNFYLSSGQIFNTNYFLYEYFLEYDTSPITNNNTVTSAIEQLYLQSDGTTTSELIEEVREYDWGGGTLTATDWVPGENLGNYTLLSSINTYAVGWCTFASTTEFTAAINKVGYTRLIHNSDHLRLGDIPTGSERLEWKSANTAGTTQDPVLIISYEEPSYTNGNITAVVSSINIISLMPNLLIERNNNIYTNTLTNNFSVNIPIISSVHPPILNVSQIGDSIKLYWI